MGHGKLKKFAENETFRCLLQPRSEEVLDRGPLLRDGVPSAGPDAAPSVISSASEKSISPTLRLKDHPIKGHWNDRMFAVCQPIVLELGCGKGEYTIDLSRRIPECNYIGVDIKGARLWKGAKYATEHQLPNVAFLRTRIEFIGAFFAPGEVSEIWLTFSDPQLKSENSRLTSPLFLERYRKFLKPGGIVHLKTDSRFLFEYSRAVAAENGLRILAATTDLYGTRVTTAPCDAAACPATAPVTAAVAAARSGALYEVQTFYERMFLKQGYKITYLSFTLEHEGPYRHPSGFDADHWRSIEGPRQILRNV